jgi:hypothetical protein
VTDQSCFAIRSCRYLRERTLMERVIPAFPSMAINISTLNRPIFPRVRSLILGCVTPRSCAASDWVSPSAPRRSRSSIINCDRSRRFSASAGSNPRSAKTFPLPRVTRGSGSRPTRDDFAVALRCKLDVAPRPLPERVEDIDRFLKFPSHEIYTYLYVAASAVLANSIESHTSPLASRRRHLSRLEFESKRIARAVA